MFISVRNLHSNMGVDEGIARFFVDRKVPADNLFWKNRLVYIGRGNGYISIPVYYDILFRIGVPKELICDDSHVQFMERIMHYAILAEYNEVTFGQQLDEIIKLLDGRVKNQPFFDRLVPYLEQQVIRPIGELGMEVPSLNRADAYLFILCDLPLTSEQTSDAIKYWYALHSTYLLMDDIYDYKFDKQDNEENSILELGEGDKGYLRAQEILKNNVTVISQINPTLGHHFQKWVATSSDPIE